MEQGKTGMEGKMGIENGEKEFGVEDLVKVRNHLDALERLSRRTDRYGPFDFRMEMEKLCQCLGLEMNDRTSPLAKPMGTLETAMEEHMAALEDEQWQKNLYEEACGKAGYARNVLRDKLKSFSLLVFRTAVDRMTGPDAAVDDMTGCRMAGLARDEEGKRDGS